MAIWDVSPAALADHGATQLSVDVNSNSKFAICCRGVIVGMAKAGRSEQGTAWKTQYFISLWGRTVSGSPRLTATPRAGCATSARQLESPAESRVARLGVGPALTAHNTTRHGACFAQRPSGDDSAF